ETAVNQYDYMVNNDNIIDLNDSLNKMYINNSASFNDLLVDNQDTGAGKKDSPSVHLDDSFPYKFEGLSKETISDEPQAQQVLYHFNRLVKALEKGHSQLSKESLHVQIPVFKGEEQDPVYWLNKFETACSVNNIQEAQMLTTAPAYLKGSAQSWWRTVVRIINNIPLQLSDTIISIDMEVNNAQGYAIIAGINWLNKVQGIIDLKRGQFKFTWNNKSYILPITYWEKPQYNNSEPIPLKNSSEFNDSNNQTSSTETNSSEISEDKYESSDNEQKESKGFLVIGNSDEKPILEINNTQVKYQNESFNNYNFYSEQTSDPRVIKCYCNQPQKAYSKCIQEKYDRHVKKVPFHIGDKVLLYQLAQAKVHSNKFSEKWKGPYYIHNIIALGAYKLRSIDDKILKRTINANRLKLYFDRSL
ncbi:11426_t:CDS:2, partial [Ambispora leptoticha]